ncbi:MAG: NAD(P)-dependent oxidoreductase [Muribaculaceae bacterium]|nr:NAD(P)-dependent oxidoreductase [Muribaculaceae bacterium]MDE7111694.1 NAD(P)-dependent oxidoreductase [Muribaculaceae bacterium]
MAEAIAEAKRCLNCKVPQCKKGCPVENDIPDWIHELSMGNLGNAMSIINRKSNLPAVCGRVCAHERQCEGHCVLGKKGRHVNIGKLERFVADFDSEMGVMRQPIVQKTKGRVAIIGSGPAGLTVAGELARRGYSVDIFEMEPQPGGVLTFGIPEYRLPKDIVNSEIEKIRQLGVRFYVNVTVGPDITIDGLFDKGYDAIFMGTGNGKPKKLAINGLENKRVRQAIYFLRRVGLFQAGLISREEVPMKEGDRIYVVGCGNTAIDAARTAVRFGASEVTIVYHRDITRMSALMAEYEDAVSEGVKFMWNTSVKEVHDDRRVTVETDGEERILPPGKLMMAVGSRPATRIVSTTTGIEVNENGFVVTRDVPYGMTTRKGVFAGGDVSGNQATVVHAMSNARAVAEGIAQYIDALTLLRAIES